MGTEVGLFVGRLEGCLVVGTNAGDLEGLLVGEKVGLDIIGSLKEGLGIEGGFVGGTVGLEIGPEVGLAIGEEVGLGVIGKVGFGAKLGTKVGAINKDACFEVGAPVAGLLVGKAVGLLVG